MADEAEDISQIDKILAQLGKVVVILGVPLFFLQEWSQNHRERVARTVDYALSLHSGDFADARAALLEPWIDRRGLIEAIYNNGVMPDDRTVHDLMMTALDGNDPDERKALIVALYRIEGLFLSLRDCVEAKVCDSETAFDVVGQDATEIACFFGTGFETINTSLGLVEFGEGILHFTDRSVCRHLPPA